MCSDDQEKVLSEWGLVVANYRVEESDVQGSVCTTYNSMVTLADGQAAVDFTADASLIFDEATIDESVTLPRRRYPALQSCFRSSLGGKRYILRELSPLDTLFLAFQDLCEDKC